MNGNSPEWGLLWYGRELRLERIEQLVPSFRLRVERIFNFEPAAYRRVRSGLSLRDHAFQIAPHDFVEQINTPAFDVFSTNNIRQFAPVDHFAQLFLSVDQWKLPQIATVEVQQIEGVENWGAATEEKFIEDAPAFHIQAN
jgi:hypothetical protein